MGEFVDAAITHFFSSCYLWRTVCRLRWFLVFSGSARVDQRNVDSSSTTTGVVLGFLLYNISLQSVACHQTDIYGFGISKV